MSDRHRQLRFTLRAQLLLTTVLGLLAWAWMPMIRGYFDRESQRIKDAQVADASAALFKSVLAQDQGGISRQLDCNADPNVLGTIKIRGQSVTRSALDVAIGNGDEESVKKLLLAGAVAGRKSPRTYVEVVLQSEAGAASKDRIIQMLSAYGADIRSSSWLIDELFASQLPDTIEMLKRNGVPYEPREMCITGDLDGLKQAFATGFDLKNLKPKQFHGTSTLLGIALTTSNSEIAKWLLDIGVSNDVGELHQANALHLAAGGNCVELYKPLVDSGCDVNGADVSGDTPLNYAIPKSSPAMVEALLNAGANANYYHEYLKCYPIHQAARRYYESVCEQKDTADAEAIVVALVRAGADPTSRDASGLTAEQLTKEFQDKFRELYQPLKSK